MKKNYNCPEIETVALSASHGVCQAVSQFGNFQQPTGTQTIDPSQGL